jgi:serine/threonine protein kinase
MNQPKHTWIAGQTLQNRYQLQQQLGDNGDRQTWLAKDLTPQPPQSVVVKLLPFHAQMQWDELKLFEREIAVLKALKHSRVPRYLDSFEIESSTKMSWFVLVEAFIPGRSLGQIIEQGHPLTAAQIRKIAVQALMILSDLHQGNPQLLHRDIKPSNLMLGKESQIYLIDFGAVQDQQNTGGTFTVVGTSGYAPPEQFFGRAVPESDLYALGATLIHLLTGTSPSDLPQQELRIQFRDLVAIPDAFAEWIEKLTAPDVSDRFPTALQALEALNAIDMKPTVRSQPHPSHSRIRLDKTTHRLLIHFPGIGLSPQQSAVFLLEFTVLGILIWWLWTGFPPSNNLPVGVSEEAQFVRILRILATIPWCMTFWTVMSQLWQQWQPNQIDFQKRIFKLDWRLLGRRWWRQSGHIVDIQEIDVGMQLSTQKYWFSKRLETPMILIQAGNRRYTFGAGFTEAENIWLLQEIKHWLKSKEK